MNSFGRMVDSLATAVTTQIQTAYRWRSLGRCALNDPTYSKNKETDTLLNDAHDLGYAMRLAYLGETRYKSTSCL